jgi:hypothetical protein
VWIFRSRGFSMLRDSCRFEQVEWFGNFCVMM